MVNPQQSTFNPYKILIATAYARFVNNLVNLREWNPGTFAFLKPESNKIDFGRSKRKNACEEDDDDDNDVDDVDEDEDDETDKETEEVVLEGTKMTTKMT